VIGEHLRLGFIPLADCAPLAVADAFGLFAEEGLSVELAREASWATIRDKLQARLLDGAHMLGPMTLASSLGVGVGGERSQLIAPMALNLNGSAITVSLDLAERMRAADLQAMSARPRRAEALRAVVEEKRAAGQPPLVFAAVFPFSIHAYALRWWLAEGGLDPDHDVRIVITPPPRMAAQLRSGEIDGFCVGSPWNAVAEADGEGEILVRTREILPLAPDKVLGVTQAFAEREPEALQALLRALIRAAAWADEPSNRPALAHLLARPEFVGQPEALLAKSLVESPGALVFHAGAANLPWLSQAAWLLAQMRRWGQIGPEIDIAGTARAVFRPDLYRTAARAAGAVCPDEDWKIETGWPAGVFDGDAAESYLQGFAIRRERAAV
jgi:ABC-type nitrate/sulfonate/bicarbonate transport system substrate-binding protein